MADNTPSRRTDPSALLSALDNSARVLFGSPALHVASHDGYKQVAEVLLVNGGNALEVDAQGQTAVEVAQTDDMKRLLEKKPPQPLPPISSSHMDACVDYVRAHKLMELFEDLAAEIIFHQPQDVKPFIIERLKKLQAARKVRGAMFDHFFTKENLETLFNLYDVSGKGYITLEQYSQAMRDIGVRSFDPTPTAAQNGRMDKKTFIFTASKQLMEA